MQELVLPVRHEWLARERAYGKIAIEPFEPGFALTAGNAYRRVLLSSITAPRPPGSRSRGCCTSSRTWSGCARTPSTSS